MNKVTVKLPEWFVKEHSACCNPSEDAYGFTDAVTKHFDEIGACYYVEVPDWNYSGYFKRSDLVLIGSKLSIRRK